LEIPNFKSWKTAFLLSIIVPVSLLATFKLTGIIKEPLAPETIQLSPVRWEFPRPDGDVHIGDTPNTSYADAECLMTFITTIGVYMKNNPAYDGNDVLTAKIEINATVMGQNAYIENVYVVVQNDNEKSLIDWVFGYISMESLSLKSYSYGKTAHISLASINYSKECYFSATLQWSLLTPNSQTHQRELICEITYYNGSAYKKLIQPFDLKLTGKGS